LFNKKNNDKMRRRR